MTPGHIGKSIRPKGFESIKPTFRILSLYTKTGVSLITAGYSGKGTRHIKGHICTGPRGPKAAAPQSDADD